MSKKATEQKPRAKNALFSASINAKFVSLASLPPFSTQPFALLIAKAAISSVTLGLAS